MCMLLCLVSMAVASSTPPPPLLNLYMTLILSRTNYVPYLLLFIKVCVYLHIYYPYTGFESSGLTIRRIWIHTCERMHVQVADKSNTMRTSQEMSLLNISSVPGTSGKKSNLRSLDLARSYSVDNITK